MYTVPHGGPVIIPTDFAIKCLPIGVIFTILGLILILILYLCKKHMTNGVIVLGMGLTIVFSCVTAVLGNYKYESDRIEELVSNGYAVTINGQEVPLDEIKLYNYDREIDWDNRQIVLNERNISQFWKVYEK